MAVDTKNTIIWGVTSCSRCQNFKGTCHRHL